MRRVAFLLAGMAAMLVLASKVALAVNRVGTNGPDTLRGTNKDDNLVGKGGQDDLFGLDGSDNLQGEKNRDNLLGGDKSAPGFAPKGGDKNLVGGPNNNLIFGGKGSDNIINNKNNNLLFECCLREFSKDTLSDGSGNDVINVSHRPAFQNVVVCGRGFDQILTNKKNTITHNYKKMVVVRGSREAVLRQVDEFFESVPDSFFQGLPPNPFR
jgi:Ca2+-binding RTX toxin-like protein